MFKLCNTTLVPNEVYDRIKEFKTHELKILLYLIRHSSEDFISLETISDFLKINKTIAYLNSLSLMKKVKNVFSNREQKKIYLRFDYEHENKEIK